jgi:hypothetical protein
MTVSPTISFNYATGNINRQNVVQTSLRDVDGNGVHGDPGDLPGSLLNDGQILKYIQSYDNDDDSLSFYYSLDDADPVFITKLTAADHSPGGNGFFDVSTGNKWGQPNNQDAIYVEYKKWGAGLTDGVLRTAKLGINSITVATTDDDRDGVINRDDTFPTDPYETVDSDSDGVGDNGDQHPGYNDSAVAAINSAAQSAGDSTFSYFVTDSEDDYSYSIGGGGIEQSVHDAVVAARDAALLAQATAETALANAPTQSQIEQTVMDARLGSTRIDISGSGEAVITMTLEETADIDDWSDPSISTKTFELGAPSGKNFYRFKMAD